MKAPSIPSAGIPPERESSKQRSLRIVLWYHRLGGGWLGSKYFWSLVAFLAAAAYVGWIGIGGETGATQISPGQVAAAHASLNSDCAKCHKPGVSLRADGGGVNWVSQNLLRIEAHAKIADKNCGDCHPREFKNPHHTKQVAEFVPSCAACHADHHGDKASLVRPDDKLCTDCHDKIALRRSGSDYSPPIKDIEFFALSSAGPRSHEPFRSLPATDVNNFKFNHQLHLLPGQWARGGDEKNAWTLEKIAPELRGGYKPVSKTDRRVLLDCDSCHVPQQGDPAAQSGAYMLPIRYEQHCKACHPLDLNLPKTRDPDAPAKEEPALLVPHGLNKREIDEFLAGISAKQNSDLPPPRFPDKIKIPGKSLSGEQKKEIEKLAMNTAQLTAWKAKIDGVLCAKCHLTELRPAAGSSDEQFEQAVGFAPPKIPARWLKHGQFDHRAHRGWADCRMCHKDVDPSKELATTLHADPEHEYEHLLKPPPDDQKVLIPKIEMCVQCHAPAHSLTNVKAAARFDCAECHRYHAGAP
jgi:predicted CXXCH cytochrome family protein